MPVQVGEPRVELFPLFQWIQKIKSRVSAVTDGRDSDCSLTQCELFTFSMWLHVITPSIMFNIIITSVIKTPRLWLTLKPGVEKLFYFF